MKKQYDYRSDELYSMACKLKTLCDKYRIIAFSGPLGSGKTTLIRELLRLYGVQGVIVSPTFSYVSLYKVSDRLTLYHFDLYRIMSVNAFLEAGFHEYLDDVCGKVFIEWPEVIASLLIQYQVAHIGLCYKEDALNERRLISTVEL